MTVAKRISPAAIHALKEALSTVYWYKNDLKDFLTLALEDPAVLKRLNWDAHKRNIVGSLIDYLASHEDRYQSTLIRLMSDVAAMDDYSQLERLESGVLKAQAAMDAVKALSTYTKVPQ